MKTVLGLAVLLCGSAFARTQWKDPEPPGAASAVVGDVRVDALGADLFRVRVKRGADWTESGLNRYDVIPRGKAEVPAGWKTPDGFRTPAAEISVGAAGEVRFVSRVSPADLTLRTALVGEGFRLEAPLAAGERVYGLGDVSRENLQRRGGRYEMWVRNVSSYIPIPVVTTTRGWGLFLNTTWRHVFDVGAADPDTLVCEAKEGDLDFYLFAGRDARALVEAYTRVTGRPTLLPAFGYGFTFVCNTTIDMWNLFREAVAFRDHDLPCDVLGLEPGWMSRNYDMTTRKAWDPAKFQFMKLWPTADANFPAGLSRMGFNLSLWLCVNYDLFRYEEQCAAGLARRSGRMPDTAGGIRETWYDDHIGADSDKRLAKSIREAKNRLVDAGRDLPEGEAPWFEHLKKFVQQGARCFKLDGCDQVGEHPKRKWANGMTDEEAHNLYPPVLAKQMATGYEDFTGRRAMVYSSGGYAGEQRYVATWAGDTGGGPKPCLSLLNLGASGHSNASCDMDISNAAGLHFGFLQTWCQQCNWRSWNQPWTYDRDHFEVIRRYAHLRYRLIPYVYTAAAEAHRTGWPVMRPLALVYPEDPSYDGLKTTYMLGDSLLVATFVQREIALPPGVWHEWRTGETVKGPCKVPYAKTADWGGGLYAKGGAIVPMWPYRPSIRKGWSAEVSFHVWPSADGTGELYEDDGDSLDYRAGKWARTPLAVTRGDGTVTFTVGRRRTPAKGGFNRPGQSDFRAVFHLDAPPAAATVAGRPATGSWDAAAKTYTLPLGNVSAAGTACTLDLRAPAPVRTAAAGPKNVIVFIGDGMSTPQRMVAEEFSRATGGGALAMNHLPYQANTRTKSANAIITDSAAAATAIACGEKTNNGMLGVLPDGTRLESVAEVAKRRGRKVGIATTVTIVHATPAGFYAHNPNRGASYQIALDLVASGFDYFCGGGVYDKWDDAKNPKYRGSVFDLAAKAGYRVIRDDRAAWRALKPGDGRSWTVFGDGGMSFAIDRNPDQPTPAEIVAKGIELMENPNGFFLMFEGGKVDYAGHANDAATNLRDILALDAAVKVALAYQETHPDTLVVTTGDHETGGLSMGFAGIGGQFKVELLATQTVSTETFSGEIKKLIGERKGEIPFDEVRPLLAAKFGLDKLSPAEEKTLSEAFAKDVENVRAKLRDTTAHDVRRRYVFAQAAKNALNARAGIGWSTGSHTALPTLTTAKGPGAEILVDMTENTDLGRRLKALLEK